MRSARAGRVVSLLADGGVTVELLDDDDGRVLVEPELVPVPLEPEPALEPVPADEPVVPKGVVDEEPVLPEGAVDELPEGIVDDELLPAPEPAALPPAVPVEVLLLAVPVGPTGVVAVLPPGGMVAGLVACSAAGAGDDCA